MGHTFNEELYRRRDSEDGSYWLAKAIDAARKGSPLNKRTEFRWCAGNGGWAQDSLSETTKRGIERADALAQEWADAMARVVSRDPCPKCGVRGDIGCRHK